MKLLSFAVPGTIIMLCLLQGCEKDPVIPNPEELITTLTYALTPSGGGPVAQFSFRDADGDGGLPPQIVVDTLSAGITYNGELRLLNESVSPVLDITDEIENEKEEHQFFYTINGLHATIEYLDLDNDGYPVGLSTTLFAAGPGQGNIVITLRHLPDKTASGVSDGILLNAGGETDIEVTFPVVIQ